ncbi:MAG: amino acid adenylation domain-containing protein [Nitrospirota bacterium]|nr:amino acid adenylation domain-containing protein [Nitrospirota bacterium]
MNTVIDLLEESFSLHKSNVAVRIYDKVWSYGELHSLSNTIARFLLEKGIQKGDRVAVLMNKSIYLYAAIIGIIKSGGVYVPLDSKAPPLRLARMLEDIDPFFVFIDHVFISRYKESREYLKYLYETAFLDDPECSDYQKILFEKNPIRVISGAPSLSSEDLTLILFTSGSTGVPKGVMITHKGFYTIVKWTLENIDLSPNDVISALNATAFDMSIMDIFFALCSGATLGVYPEEVIFPKDILKLTYHYGVTKMVMVPSTFNLLVKSGLIQPERLNTLKDVFLGGEPPPLDSLKKIMNKLPHTKFHNIYGPAETTLYLTINTLNKPPDSDEGLLPVGFPVTGNSFVLDNTDLINKKNRGELIIFGPQVAAGYWNDPEKTDSAFGVNKQGERFYRTGDIASFDPERGYFIHGRKDNQIKFRGYRIELEEIEYVVSSLGFVKENVVIPLYKDGEVKELKLVYSAARECSREILRKLKKIIPNYMIPKYFIYLEQLPKNKSNKIDRALLKEKYGNF